MTEGKKRQEKNQRKYKYWIAGGIALVIIIVIIIVFTGRTSIFVTSNCQQVPYEEQEEYTKTEYYTESVPYTDQECENKQLVYSITNFDFYSSVCNQKVEECIDYTLGFCTSKKNYCVDKTVSCSLMLNNLDSERGNWEIGFKFYETGSSLQVASNSKSVFMYPSSSETVIGTGRITTKEPYEQSYSCNYYVADEPTKQVCRDVIKYREVQRERQVTAYRPVTKYKEVCD